MTPANIMIKKINISKEIPDSGASYSFASRWVVMVAAVISLCFFMGSDLSANSSRPSHNDINTNPDGCGACHAGKGKIGTPLLRSWGEELCYKCHSKESRGYLRARTDIKEVFGKFSVHPIEGGQELHSSYETLPATNPDAPRHVTCADCHVVHITTPDEPTKGARGYLPAPLREKPHGNLPKGVVLKESPDEYQKCYLCHADSANLPVDKRNISREFNPANASFHPVEMPGRNSSVPSLIDPMDERSELSCSSCHGNDDLKGPRGPHGSDFPPLLIAKYTIEDGNESHKAYELCYLCHDRNSVLNDESFKRHSLHIQAQSTSCAACHAAHGSVDNGNLIDFAADRVFAANTTATAQYIAGSGGQPKCYLTCHGIEHRDTGIGNTPWPW